MSNKKIRLRFAPSPTGIMHLGNIRTALLNYLFAHQKDGTFIIRLEDTDLQRNFDPSGKKIQEDLLWLALAWEEGPTVGGPFGPYAQSERFDIYQKKLNELTKTNAIYRCFCSSEELEKKRLRQIALKQPPRYDRICLKLSQEAIEKNLAEKKPYIWRFNVAPNKQVQFEDLARGLMTFDANNFFDFPISRQDGSPTFMFANAVDDILMQISHVLRGEDHLTNTVGQVLLLEAMGAPLPIYWHLPILCNTEGKKLSKRDFGFSLDDLRKEGFLHEAIINYLAIIGGSYEHEIMSMPELIAAMKFEQLHHSGHITYDEQKLRWVNHKWIERLDLADLAQRCTPFLQAVYPQVQSLSEKQLEKLIHTIRTDISTLKESTDKLRFYFETPAITLEMVNACVSAPHRAAIKIILEKNKALLNQPDLFADTIKTDAQSQKIPLKELFWVTRLALTGKQQGVGIALLVDALGAQESTQRIDTIITLL